jgi:hypothetical protein
MKPTQILSRFPFTVAILAIVAIVSLSGVANIQPFRQNLFERIGERMGLLPWHMQRGELFRFAVSVFVSRVGMELVVALALLALGVGTAERRAGTGKTIFAFFGIHTAVILVISALLALRVQRSELLWQSIVLAALNVGPSAGYCGCFGVGCHKQSPKIRAWLLSVIGGVLFARAVWVAHDFGFGSVRAAPDLAHVLGFALGVAIGKRF